MSTEDYSTFPPPPPPVSNPSNRRLPLLTGVLIGLLGGYLLISYMRGELAPVQKGEQRPVQPRGDLAADEKATIELFESASPSVVYITSLAQRRDLFGLNVFEVPQGTGSGFIWDELGHIVTNFHVIMDANAVKVTLSDHTEWDASFVGAEPSKDLAVLRISTPAQHLTPIMLGDSKDLRVGQKVFAIGNPFGLDYTLTTGIISALGRAIRSFGNRTIEGVIQTDAAINPGNSGGPLLDSAGRLIGVTTQIASPSGASAGIGFAVPVDIVNEVVPQIIAHGRVVRPVLGIQVLDDSLARRFRADGLLQEEGVVVRNVTEGSGAAAAGLRGTSIDAERDIIWGDIIVGIDDRKIKSYNDLVGALEKYKVGDKVVLQYLRNGQERQAEVMLQAP